MTRRIPFFIAAIIFSLCCTACTGLVQRPTASLRAATVKDLTADGISVNFAIDLANPNAFEIPLSAAQYKLALGGVGVIDDSAPLGGALPANGTLPLNLPVTLRFESLLKAEQAIRDGKGEVPYKLDGGLDFKGREPFAAIPVHVPLNFEGTLSLRKVLSDPVALMKNPAARKLAAETLGGIFSR